MMRTLRRFLRETEGQDLIEYALLAATISIGALAGMRAIRDAVNTEFTAISNSINTGS